jgi:predicted ATPase
MYNAWIVCTKKRFDSLMEEDPKPMTVKETIETIKPKEEFYVLEKSTGNYSNTYYRMRTLERYSIVPNEAQQKIVDSEIDIFRQNNSAVFFVSGPCGRGKSMTAVFLAKALNAMYCEDCTPWEPGDSIQSMFLDFQHDNQKSKRPLVVCFDEVDVVLEKICTNKIPNNDSVQTNVRDKIGWNRLFSKIERGLFPGLIIVMTSNKTPEQIIAAVGDPSLIRKGRVDRFYTM